MAGWHCEACARALCPACAAPGPKDLPICATCGQLAPAILVPRAVVAPFSSAWAPALRRAVTWHAAAQWLIAGLVIETLLAPNIRAWLIGRALQLGWVLYLARRAALGYDPFGVPHYVDLWSVWVGPLPRFFAGAGVALLGAAWISRFGSRAVPLGDPWALGFSALAIALVPAALTLAVIEGEGARAVWPWQMRGRVGAALLPLQGVMVVVVLMELVTGSQAPFSREDTKLDLHIIEAFVPRMISTLSLAVLAVLAGTLVWTRATEFKHAEPADDLVPRLDDVPTGHWQPPGPSPEEQAAEKARRFAPISLDDPNQELAALLARKDVDAALAWLSQHPAVDSVLMIDLAQLVAGRGDAATASTLLREGLVRPPDEQTPRALVILARLSIEKLGARDEGEALYRRVLAEFPGTHAAEFAAGQLRSPTA